MNLYGEYFPSFQFGVAKLCCFGVQIPMYVTTVWRKFPDLPDQRQIFDFNFFAVGATEWFSLTTAIKQDVAQRSAAEGNQEE